MCFQHPPLLVLHGPVRGYDHSVAANPGVVTVLKSRGSSRFHLLPKYLDHNAVRAAIQFIQLRSCPTLLCVARKGRQFCVGHRYRWKQDSKIYIDGSCTTEVASDDGNFCVVGGGITGVVSADVQSRLQSL